MFQPLGTDAEEELATVTTALGSGFEKLTLPVIDFDEAIAAKELNSRTDGRA